MSDIFRKHMDGQTCVGGVKCIHCNPPRHDKTFSRNARHILKAQDRKDYNEIKDIENNE